MKDRVRWGVWQVDVLRPVGDGRADESGGPHT